MGLLDEIRAQLKARPQLSPPLERCDSCLERKPDLVQYYAEIRLPALSDRLFPSSEGVERQVLINFRLCDACQRGIADVYANIPSLIGQDLSTTAKIGECGGG